MSDPVTNVEIEDVLSSIRRLVSADARPQHVMAQPAPDRLVLTPSQRVAEEEPKVVADGDASDGDASDLAKADPAQDPILLTDFATAPAEEAAEPDMAEPEASEPETPAELQIEADEDSAETMPEQDDALARLVEQEVTSALEAFSQPDSVEVDAAPKEELAETSSPEDHADVAPPLSLKQKVAQLEAMIAGTPGDWEEEEAAPDGNAAFLQNAPGAMPWQDYTAGDEDEAGPDDAPETVPEAPTADAKTPNDTKPEPFDDQNIMAQEPVENRDEDPVNTPSSDQLSVEDAPLIDEEMLRDMVAEIVRQELQGALGERITRNVRKLVRREIHRALLSQQLE